MNAAGEGDDGACRLPEVSSDSVDLSDFDAEAAVGAVGGCRRPSLLDTWKAHPNFRIGLRLAELATMWHVNGWSKELFPRFMLWAREQFPFSVGDINHSERFVTSFLPSLVATAHTCTASSLHSIVPATGLPSLLGRAIDILSIKSYPGP